jgi:outer membrane protein OmpA-like peptidoglycan-associated protein
VLHHVKSLNLTALATVALIAGFVVTGCRKGPQRPVALPGQATTQVGGPGKPEITVPQGATPTNPVSTEVTAPGFPGAHPVPKEPLDPTREQVRTKWANETVHFDFDRSVVRAGDTAKLDKVAREFKAGDRGWDLLLEGHCDERGTPEYNRSLGERRALALREYLIRSGLDPQRVHTISFGKDKPVALGHDEAAWAQNRRGDFILVLPKK